MYDLKNIKFKNILDIKEINIPRGKITCIVGESGSGKTTLLRMLNNLTSPDSGDIFYNGESIFDIDPVSLRRKAVMLPQTPAIFSGTVRDNLLIGLKLSQKPEVSDEELIKAMDMVKLSKDLDSDSDFLSGGEKQRLAIARVMLMDPEVLLLDEPSSALDEDTEQFVISSLVEYARDKKKTMVMVTHSKKIAREFADEIIEIKNKNMPITGRSLV
ncbi:ABC transporter ATP-binding protein [Alkalibacter saccharofermentans]|uniref:Putative ABC transport system ATP-binding protein n=1 Tax=Alkalibacter saccharofermentans DSM 14828 TaxID=1120975 RepID=A0A1M4WYN6_9FIRM|nr:ABC transporter ATP-binding protein [Alkalibacter saccharofermentans]SHE86183.1 putative ABC transport system ATP-binding protein [Alkalibacter saccharofermentans DSM 14828]